MKAPANAYEEEETPKEEKKTLDNTPSELDELTHQELRLMYDRATQAILYASYSGANLAYAIILRAFLT